MRLGIGPKLRGRWPFPSWVVAVSEGRRRCHIVCAASPDCVPCFERYWGPEG